MAVKRAYYVPQFSHSDTRNGHVEVIMLTHAKIVSDDVMYRPVAPLSGLSVTVLATAAIFTTFQPTISLIRAFQLFWRTKASTP